MEPMLSVLRDCAAPFRRLTAGERIPAAEIPEAERTALIAAGYLGLVIAVDPLPAVAPADAVAD